MTQPDIEKLQEVNHKDMWWDNMISKHGSRAAVVEFMRQSGAKAKRTGTGGFAYLQKHDPAKLKKISSEAGSWTESKTGVKRAKKITTQEGQS